MVKISVEGEYYRDRPNQVRPEYFVWLPDQLVLKCGCGEGEWRSGIDDQAPNAVCPRCGANHKEVVDQLVSQKNKFRDHIIYPGHPLYEDLINNNREKKETKTVRFASDVTKSFANETSETKHELKDAIVLGRLDLRFEVIKSTVIIHDCWFFNDVDLRYCEFKQHVEFTRCTFHDRFNSGDYRQSHTIYRKDLACVGSRFKSVAWFNAAKFEGSAYFHGATFESKEEKSADFTAATFGRSFECQNSIFKGPVSFRGITCNHAAVFREARFEQKADFDGASFRSAARFPNATFVQKVEFIGASFGGQFECNDATFMGKVRFDAIRCARSGFFDRAKFLSIEGVVFGFASFGLNLYCNKAIFRGEANFSSITCTHRGYFGDAQFQNRNTIFHRAHFGSSLHFQKASFEGKVDAGDLTCDSWVSLRNAKFEAEVDFRFVCVGANLDLRSAYFAKKVRLGEARISQKLRLHGACFMDTVELYDATIKVIELLYDNPSITKVVFAGKNQIDALKNTLMSLENENPEGKVDELCKRFTRVVKDYGATEEPQTQNGPADLKTVRAFLFNDGPGKQDIPSKDLKSIEFQFDRPEDGKNDLLITAKEVLDPEQNRKKLQESVAQTIRCLWPKAKTNDDPRNKTPKECFMGGFFPFKKEKSWDLSDITFERFHGGPEWLSREFAKMLVSEQDPEKFSRAPYLQLENYYNRVGDEVEANEIHYSGHCAFRKNAWSSTEKGRTQWSLGRKITDTVLMATVGWGHKTGRIFLWIFLFLVIGTLIFSWNEDTLAVNYQSVSKESVQKFGIDFPLPRGISEGYFWPDLLYGFAYSLALFIPVINVGYAYWFIPSHGLAQIYAGIHAILGWILVGLLLVSWAGIFDRK